MFGGWRGGLGGTYDEPMKREAIAAMVVLEKVILKGMQMKRLFDSKRMFLEMD